MSAGLKRANSSGRRMLSVAAAIATAGLLYGCDNPQNEADKRVRAQLQEARMLSTSGSEEGLNAAQTQLDQAANDQSASDSLRADAHAARGRAEMRRAQSLITVVDKADLDISRLVSEIAALTEQIRGTSTTVAGYRQFDPKPTLDAIAEKVAAAEGGADKPVWFSSNDVTLPTLAAVKQQLAKLEGDLSTKQTDVTNLSQQRTALLDQAEKAVADSDQLKGSQSVDAFKKGSDLRKQAGDIGVQIEHAQSDIAKIKLSIATATAQQTAVNDTINQLKDQAATIDKAWKEMDTRSAAQRQLAGEILGSSTSALGGESAGKSTAGGTIAQKAAELARLTTDAKKNRESAQARLTNAAKSFEDADKAASNAVRQLKTLASENPNRPERAQWEQMQKVLDPMQYRLEQAGAQRALGALASAEAAATISRITLANSLQQALSGTELSVPTGIIDTSSSESYKAALGMSDQAYKEADALLDGINEAVTLETIKNDALIGRALTSYGWAQVARQLGDEATAKKRIEAAKGYRDLAGEKMATLPAMPAELGAFVKKAPAPETPAEGATPPAEGATTAPAEASATTAPAAAPAQ